jgi:acyl-CoA thioesterase I
MRKTTRSSRRFAAILVLLGALVASRPAQAQIVALGASNVAGHGVAPDDAFPARLEAMLREKGYRVSVANAGVNGDTSTGLLSRLDAATPPGTTIVLLDISGPLANNPHEGIGSARGAADMAAVRARLKARGIIVIPETANAIARRYRQADGRHLTEEGHGLLAAKLLPEVMRALGPPR